MQEDSDMPVGFPTSFQEIRQMNHSYNPIRIFPDILRERLTVITGDTFCADREIQSIYQEIT